MIPRRILLAAAALPLARPAFAQGWPTRPVTLMVPFAAGGASDILARVLAQRLSLLVGQGVVVDNRGGAGGTMATEAVARGAADGHTLLWAHMGTLAIAPHLYPRLGYDPLRDLAPVSLVARLPMVLVVNRSLGVNTLAEFIALARARPEGIEYGTAGQGSNTHLGAVAFEEAAGIRLLPVHYRGSGPVMTDVVAGTVKATLTGIPAALPLIRDRQVVALGVSSLARSAALPDVPTIAEGGVPGFDVTQWHGIAAPGRTPAALLESQNAAIVATLGTPDMRDRLAAEGAAPEPTTIPAFRALIAAEQERWGALIRRAGVRLE